MAKEIYDASEVWVGRDYGGMTYDITPELVAAYIAGTGDDNPWYREASPLGAPIAPALILHSAQYRKTDWGDRVSFLGKVVIHFFDETRWRRTLQFVR